MSKIVLVSVSDDRQGRKGGVYRQTQKFMSNILSGFIDHWDYTFDDCIKLSEIKTPLMLHIDAGMNGRWYKPFAIKDALSKINYGDFLIYNDCSPELWNNVNDVSSFDLGVIAELTESNNDILTCFVKWDSESIPKNGLGMHIHRYFTTDLCMEAMDLMEYANSFQHASGMICIRKTKDTVQFVDDWLYWNIIPECASLGDPETNTDMFWQMESDRKIGHRHDQSISGLLLNSRNANLIDILYNEINPFNFLQFCRVGQEYSFINSNTPIEPRMDMSKVFIRVGSNVQLESGRIVRVWGVNGNEIKVGQFEESCWIEDRNKLRLV